ncbi:acetylornithine aminotransferase [Armillaria novae-zelandiae]|uniref:Acetylornithine aminotransferase n=1 Tax=Armillaria novae-zelandiae TaxID=153914 RepID=A0AA39NVQ9_9AGAR|nr:acetylornithine aminotransferase [Armillaria novae-zelandiae]
MPSTNASLLSLGQKHTTHGLGRVIDDAIIKNASGSYMTFDDGRTMLDFTCGIGVTSLGHCHPQISKAAADQCMSVVHGQCSIAFHTPYVRLIEELLPMMPDPSLDSFFFWNSGSEAIEAALKIARIATGRQNIICMQSGYHGRTFGAMAVTRSKTIYSAGVHPIMPGVFQTPYPYFHPLGLPKETSPAELSEFCLKQLGLVLTSQTAPSDTAAIIIEPILGEGGYVSTPVEFLQGLRRICDTYGIMLIIDEVQSGFSRSGDYFAIEQSGVRPDILVIAKGLANGFPLSGVISRKELTDKLPPGSMGGTYAGNAISCAAAVEVAKIMKGGDILPNVRARSKQAFDALNALAADPEVGKYILDVRGRGLMIGLEFKAPAGPAEIKSGLVSQVYSDIPAGLAAKVMKRCVKKGLLILTTSAFEVLRLIPPLNITEEDMKKGIDIIAESIKEAVKESAN